jgi:hypothetical protein
MNKSRIFSSLWTGDVAPHATFYGTGTILNTNREFKIKKIIWTCRLSDTVSGVLIPLEQNVSQNLFLQFLPGTPQPIASSFVDMTPAVFSIINGEQVYIFRPGEYSFDNFYVTNAALMRITHSNHDALLTISFDHSLIAEIEDL